MTTMTKAAARKRVGALTDTELAGALGISAQAVSKWGDDDTPIPRERHWQIIAEKPRVKRRRRRG